MYIHEAVREAMKINGIIFRKSMRRTESEIFAVIKPSNSYETCQLIISRYGKAERAARSWNRLRGIATKVQKILYRTFIQRQRYGELCQGLF